MEVFPDDVENNSPKAEGVGSSVIVREKGHYFGNCIYFDSPDMAPVGMDNKAIKKYTAAMKYCLRIMQIVTGEAWTEYKTQR